MCTEDDVLPNGIQVYAGDLLNWSSYSMGRYEGIWGNDVLKFIPDRFLNSEDGLKPSQYKFPCFNAGPRLWYYYYYIDENFLMANYMLTYFFFI